MDNDSAMIDTLGGAIVTLQVKYREASLEDRAVIGPLLQDALNDYSDYQDKLLKEGVITTDADLETANTLAALINQAADRQNLLNVISKVIAFIATKV